ncbi:MAG: sugar ABC transporter permease [Candidatus Aerophobus sp.]|nr:MAG: sugar ABC transporter permease [Candidatus Aerophobus sp.]
MALFLDKRRWWREQYFYYIILAPAVVIFTILTVFPISRVLQLAFYHYRYITGEIYYVGLKNFVKLLNDGIFIKSITNTFEFVILATFSEFTIGLGLALLFHREFKAKRYLLPIVIFPMMLPTIVISGIWKIIYHYEFGVLNNIFRIIGLSPVEWLTNKNLAMKSIVLVDIWQWTPLAFLVLCAGLQGIPREIYEAAQIDGAGRVQIFSNITLPLLKQHILLVILLRTIDTFRIFDKVYALTGGGPGISTETITYYIYREGFKFFNLGYASAASVIMLLLTTIISAVYIKYIIGAQ